MVIEPPLVPSRGCIQAFVPEEGRQVFGGLVLCACVLVGAVVSASPVAFCTDLPFGADTLPYLEDHADLIVQVDQFDLVRSEDQQTPHVLSIEVSAVIRSSRIKEVKKGDRLLILFFSGGHADSDWAASKSLVFLSKPLTDMRKNRWVESGSENEVREVLSGGHGIISIENDSALESALRDYLARSVARGERLVWADDYLETGDNFLQRSAIFESAMSRYDADENDRAEGLKLLGRALKSSAVSPPNKGLALELLARSQSRGAVDSLAEFAEIPQDDLSLHDLRKRAVLAIAGLAGKEHKFLRFLRSPAGKVLWRWKNGDDAFLREEARREFQRRSEAKERPSFTDEERDNILEDLQSRDKDERLKAASNLVYLDHSEEVLTACKSVIEDPDEVLAVKLTAIDVLVKFDDLSGCGALRDIAKNELRSESVRTMAILGLADLEFKAAVRVLKGLAKTLPEGSELQKLADGLSTKP